MEPILNVFISQPMNGLSDEEILKKREEIIKKVEKRYPNKSIEIIDSFFQGAPHDASPVWFLGKSIQLLSQADLLVMGEGWEDARGCKLEYEIAAAYGIPIFTPYADITK